MSKEVETHGSGKKMGRSDRSVFLPCHIFASYPRYLLSRQTLKLMSGTEETRSSARWLVIAKCVNIKCRVLPLVR